MIFAARWAKKAYKLGKNSDGWPIGFCHLTVETFAEKPREHMHEIISTHNKHKSYTHTLFYINAHIYIYGILGNLGLIPRRGLAASTAQFRNFYGKSSLIKFNEL